jgi:hypothetical protein
MAVVGNETQFQFPDQVWLGKQQQDPTIVVFYDDVTAANWASVEGDLNGAPQRAVVGPVDLAGLPLLTGQVIPEQFILTELA